MHGHAKHDVSKGYAAIRVQTNGRFQMMIESFEENRPCTLGRTSPSDLESFDADGNQWTSSGQRTSPSDLESNRANPLKLQDYS